jgi:hypothetical protein
MKRLILTSGTGTPFVRSDFADLAVIFTYRFVWGPLPSPDELASYLAARSDRHAPGGHWSDFSDWRRTSKARKHLGLVEFCQDCETVELWFDPSPNAQLQLIWLLDYFRSYPATVVKLKLRLVNDRLTTMTPEELSRLHSTMSGASESRKRKATVLDWSNSARALMRLSFGSIRSRMRN